MQIYDLEVDIILFDSLKSRCGRILEGENVYIYIFF